MQGLDQPATRSWRQRLRRLLALDLAQWRVVIVSLALVPWIQFRMKRHGFRATSELLAHRSDRPLRTADHRVANEVADAVAIVAGRRFVGARCLGRSLTIWTLLRRRGMDAVLKIGADPQETGPHPAHAWVELDGAPVGDEPGVEHFGSFGLSLPRLRTPSSA